MPMAHPLRTGDPRRLGAYELSGRLGEGGQGVVYLGTRDEDTYAVKLLHGPVGDERAAFLREVELAKQVARFCTAQVVEAGFDDGRAYIVSEYVDGPSLARDVAQTGPRTGAALERLAVGTATALAAIHRAGIVHRDFKPQNVLLGADGPRVIDFGLARALDAAATVSGRGVGTPAYMAPEQITASAVTGAADVFSWGATLCFAANASAPFGQDSVAPVLHRILTAPPDLGRLEGRLREIVAGCLDKDARNRPSSRELLLELLGGGDGVPAEVLRSPPPHILRVEPPAAVPAAGPVAGSVPGSVSGSAVGSAVGFVACAGAGSGGASAVPVAEPEATGTPGGYHLPAAASGAGPVSSDGPDAWRAAGPGASRGVTSVPGGGAGSGVTSVPGGGSGSGVTSVPGSGSGSGGGAGSDVTPVPGGETGSRVAFAQGAGPEERRGAVALRIMGNVPDDPEQTRRTGRAANRAGLAASAALLVSAAVLVSVVVPGLRKDEPSQAAAVPTVVTVGPADAEPEPERSDGIATQENREAPEAERSSDPPARTSVGVRVPALEGLDRAAATAALKRAGLVAGAVTQVGSRQRVGRVLDSRPAAGASVARGSAVTLRVSAGLAVPAVAGLQRAAAESALRAAGLAVGGVGTTCSAKPDGQVLSSKPGAGTRVSGGAKVALVVSRHGAIVPAVVGRLGPAARAALRAAGFTVTMQRRVVAEDAQVGTVLAQSVAAGACAAPGGGVVITVGVAGQSEPDPTEPSEPPVTETPQPTPTEP
ncbi:beta-lactam-binding protein with PASTA domain/predicted Ser/Thr protein kinase [Nonomuraea muscovyensis]|uniref:non-specific serine/threonine protein kinase n=2 Tax=Nonomuraea muscovyensis TaxID=1124761 RepID=A0A7X0EXG1_9ACTN|nr:beta-lactam-binding protein with PASTA domain/predicted Ser/Thr protein kinase [Nonomuraea muscovyensis]